MQEIHVLIIDPQNDFCDPRGALSVPGADTDMHRLAARLRRLPPSAIHVTLDTHHWFDIAHPAFWVGADGVPPSPFTVITEKDLANGTWKTARPEDQSWARAYTHQLAANHRFELCIWPPHCLIGSWGTQVESVLFDALKVWEAGGHGMVTWVLKGETPRSEHYSAFRAEVPRPEDPATGFNRALLGKLAGADLILIAGEAASHCVRFSTLDLLDNLPVRSDGRRPALALLVDAMSPVPGFEPAADEFRAIASARGVRLMTCDELA